MTPQNLQAAFPAATGRDEAAGWIIDRDFLTMIIRRVWKSGRMLAVSSIDVQAILLAAIELAGERRLTVEVGQIDPAAVPLGEMLKLGPNAGLLADLVDSLCSTPPTANNQGEAAP